MPVYHTRPDVETLIDHATGPQTVQTPWGITTVRAGDLLVPHGDRTVPIPEALWSRWFEVREPAPSAEVDAVRVWPNEPFAEWLRRDLEDYSREVLGEEPPNFPRKGELAKWVAGKVRIDENGWHWSTEPKQKVPLLASRIEAKVHG